MIILTGASASGKTEVGKYLSTHYNIKKVITYTTRQKRVSEVDGVDYHFITKDDFLKLKMNDFFFETMEYNDNFYGTARTSLKGNTYVILDYHGLKKYLESDLHFISFYLDVSEEVRYKRMLERGDGETNAKGRILLDREAFPKEMKDLVSYVIDGDDLSVSEEAALVYKKVTKNE